MITRRGLLLVLAVVLVGAAIIRLWRLGADGHPLLWDEAALGYNGYSIAKTGRDEYGTLLPLILKSFGDYKPAFYAYTTIVPEWLFGLNEFSVRLPSAVAGVVIVLLIYLAARELFGREGERVGVWAAIVAAANPWLIHFSRGAWEANFNLMLTLSGTYLFLLGRRKRAAFILSAICFGLTFFTYQSAKLFTPLLVAGLAFFFVRGTTFIKERSFRVGAFILVFFSAVAILLAKGTSGRLAVYNVFAYGRSSAESEAIAVREGVNVNSPRFLIFHGGWVEGLRRVLEGYFSYFSGRFLVYEGDWTDVRQGSPYVGEFYWPDLVLVLIGLVVLVRSRKTKEAGFIGYWVAISPLPGALSRDVVTSVRALNLAIPLILVISLGFESVWLFVSRRRKLVLAALGLGALIYLWNVAYYIDSYFVHAPVTFPDQRLYGYKEAIGLLDTMNRDNRPVFFTQKMGQPYVYVLFYNKVDPSLYQSQAHLTENPSGDVGEVRGFANYTFRNIYWPSDRGIRGAYFVGTEDELPLKDIDPRQAAVVGDVKRPDGTIAFRIVRTY